MLEGLDNVLGGSEDILGSIGDAIGGGNVMLDPAEDMRRTLADIFAAIIEVFSFLRTMLSI